MRKRILIGLLLLIGLSSVFSSNLQKIYTVNDSVYKRIDLLCRRAGVVGPSSFSPMNGRTLEIALDRINVNDLSELEKREYNELLSILHNNDEAILNYDGYKLELGVTVDLSLNIADYSMFDFRNPDKAAPDRKNEQLIPYKDQNAALSLYPKMFFGDNIFLESDFSMQNNDAQLYESSLGWLLTGTSEGLSFFGSKTWTAYAPELPYRAGMQVGNKYFNAILGRFPHSIGSGQTGNLIIGDNFIYQELLALSFNSRYFTYNMSITRFDQMDYDGADLTKATITRSEFSGPQQFRVVHRLDANILDRFRFAVDFSTIYNSTYGFDFRYLLPFYISHNYYNYDNYLEKKYFDEANNLMGFNAELAIVDGLSIGFQFALDQFQTFFEDKTSVPSAYGMLGNIKYSAEVGSGWIDSWVEVAYTNPFLYMNGKYDKNQKYDLNLDYIVGYHVQYISDVGYTGYIYGPDSFVISFGSEYKSQDEKFRAGMNLQYKAQGQNRLKYSASDIKSTTIDMSNSIIGKDKDDYLNAKTPSGGWDKAEHLIKIATYGEYNFNYGFSAYAAGCINAYFNYCNVVGETAFTPQIAFGVKWSGI